jgi:molecular chaperone Hsp33
VRVFQPKVVTFRCSCSRERVERALRIAGRTEIESILAECNEVVVTCEFCNHRYAFAEAEARAVFAPEVSSTRH